MSTRNHPPGRWPKRVLAVRVLTAKVAWLDGQPYWENGHVIWQGPNDRMAPTAADLARTQRCLNRIEDYPISARLALTEIETWLRLRRERLEVAKLLQALAAPDLPALVRQARTRHPAVVQRLVSLLTAEALCLNPLPGPPSLALLAAGPHAEGLLCAFVETPAKPLAARALAALTLGALRHADDTRPSVEAPHWEEKWLRAAYRFGVRAGLPAEPALTAILLQEKDGPALVERGMRALSSSSLFCLTPEIVRERLAAGIPAAQVIAVAEAAAEIAPLAERLLQRPEELPASSARQRQALAEQLRQQRQEALAGLREVLFASVRANADPEDVRRIDRFTRAMLPLSPHTEDVMEITLTTLQATLELPARLQGACLDLLIEGHERLWDPATIKQSYRDVKAAQRFRHWLFKRWRYQAQPLLWLLRITEDISLVRDVMGIGIQREFRQYQWSDPGLYRLLLSLENTFNTDHISWKTHWLGRLLNGFSSAPAARAALQPVVQPLQNREQSLREKVLFDFLSAIDNSRDSVRAELPRLARYIPQIVRFATQARDERQVTQCVAGLLNLERASPERAEAWITWLVTYLLDLERHDHIHYSEYRIPPAMRVAVSLANGDTETFKQVFRAVLLHTRDANDHQLTQGLSVLTRYPSLRLPLAHLFPQHPSRCVTLLVRLGLAMRLGAEVLAPLAALEAREPDRLLGESEATASADRPSGWRELVGLAPDLEPTVTAYFHAQALIGGDRELPTGVRKALEQPRRWADEHTYLERLLVRHPERSELAARVAKLQALLADEASGREKVREDIGERLRQITAEAQLAAAEQQIVACYWKRLEAVAGPLPSDLKPDDDLFNATLLTVDIDQNRRLLLRLLRAYLAGEHDWRERHPANRAFLEALAARGVATDAWLAAHPLLYRFEGGPGRRVRLHLEQNPIAILQMGNYFDTCLSFGAFNSFSTVANACELNKRVLYATDGAGRVVGRKLIGINAEGNLIGFHTYTSLANEAGNAALRALIRHYLGEFAGRCGLQLASVGTIPTLFAEAWYDDGAVSWEDEQYPPHVKVIQSSAHRALQRD